MNTITKGKNKETFIYDIETYPNLLALGFKSTETRLRECFYIWTDPANHQVFINQYTQLLDFLLKRVRRVVGYNNQEFDDIIINYLMYERERLIKADALTITREIKQLANMAIASQHDRKTESSKIVRKYKKLKFVDSFDLMVIFNKIERVSLKQLAVNLKWHTIIDLPYHHELMLDRNQADQVLIYLDNDVDITELVLQSQSEEIRLRSDISKRNNIDVLNSCRTDIAKAVLLKFISEELNIPIAKLKKGRTFRDMIYLKDCINPTLRLYTKEGKRLLEHIAKSKIDPNKLEDEKKKTKKQFEFIYKSKYCFHTIGIGGIHSNNNPEILESNDSFIYMDIDVEGYYPRIIDNEDLFPAHIGPRFNSIYRNKIIIPRVTAKALSKTNKMYATDADTLKIVANGTFGLTNSIYSFLYDPLVTLKTCLNGELYLIILIEILELYTSATVVYSNTDGLTIRIPIDQYAAVLKLCSKWEETYRFKLEYKLYKKMVLYDVNNYLIITESGDVKLKGFFNVEQALTKGYKYPIISKALYDYYVFGTDVKETIKSCTDVYMFIKSQRTDIEKFDVILKNKHGRSTILQKTNRWIVTQQNPNEGMIMSKDKENNELTHLQKGFWVTIVNDIQDIPITDYCLNYDFYINQCLVIINTIKNRFTESHIANIPSQLELTFN